MLTLPLLLTIIIFGYAVAFIIGYVYYYQKKYGQKPRQKSHVTIKELLENVSDENKSQFIEKQQKTMEIITETKRKISEQAQATVPEEMAKKYLAIDKTQETQLIREGAKLLKHYGPAEPISEEQRKTDMDELLKAASQLDAMENETPIENVEEHFSNVGYGLWMDTIAQGIRKITSDATIRKNGILQVEKLMSFLPRAFDPKEIRNALQLMKKSKEIIDLVELNPKTIVVAFTAESADLKMAEKVLLAATANEEEMSKQKVKMLFGWEDDFLNETIAHLQALNILQIKGDKLVAEGLLSAKDRENIKQKQEARKTAMANPAPQAVSSEQASAMGLFKAESESSEETPTPPVMKVPAVPQIPKMPATLPKSKQGKSGEIPLPPTKPSIPGMPEAPTIPAMKPLKSIPKPPAGKFVPKVPAVPAMPKVAKLPPVPKVAPLPVKTKTPSTKLPSFKGLPAIKPLPPKVTNQDKQSPKPAKTREPKVPFKKPIKPTAPGIPMKPVVPQVPKLPVAKKASLPAKKAIKSVAKTVTKKKPVVAAKSDETAPEHYVQIGNVTPINETQRQLDIEDIMSAVAELEKEGSFSSGKEKANMRIYNKEGKPVDQEELIKENQVEEGTGEGESIEADDGPANAELVAEKILAVYEKQEIVNGGVMQLKKLKRLLSEEGADLDEHKLASTLEVVKTMGMISNIIQMAGDDQLILFKDMELGPDELGIIQLALGTRADEFTKDNIVQLLNVPEELVLDALKKLQDKSIIRFSGDAIEIPGIIQE